MDPKDKIGHAIEARPPQRRNTATFVANPRDQSYFLSQLSLTLNHPLLTVILVSASISQALCDVPLGRLLDSDVEGASLTRSRRTTCWPAGCSCGLAWCPALAIPRKLCAPDPRRLHCSSTHLVASLRLHHGTGKMTLQHGRYNWNSRSAKQRRKESRKML
jgi:hypothetical protein